MEWIEGVLDRWEFDVIASAHNGVLKYRGKERLKELVEATKPVLKKYAEKWAKGEKEPFDPSHPENHGGWSNDPKEHECG